MKKSEPPSRLFKSIHAKIVNTGLSASSADLYVNKVLLLAGTDTLVSVTFLRDTKKVIASISERENLNTRRSYATAVLSVVQVLGRTYKSTIPIYRKNLEEIVLLQNDSAGEPNTKNLKQRQNWVSWDSVLETWEDVKNDAEKVTKISFIKNFSDRVLWNKFLVLSLYVLIPPRRNVDYQKIKYGKEGDDESYNYYDGETFFFNEYKTKKTYGQQQVDVPKDLQKVIDTYIEYNEVKPGELLLRGSDTLPSKSTNNITNILNSIFDPKKVSSSMLRHSFVTFKRQPYEETLQKLDDLAKSMGHSTNTQATVYHMKD